jgi:hypothetical protein
VFCLGCGTCSCHNRFLSSSLLLFLTTKIWPPTPSHRLIITEKLVASECRVSELRPINDSLYPIKVTSPRGVPV